MTPALSSLLLAVAMPLQVSPDDPLRYWPPDLPAIVRHRDLPMRMTEEIHLEFAKHTFQLEEGYAEFFDRVLRTSTQPDLQSEAAQSLARIAHEGLADIGGSVDILRRRLRESPDRRVRQTCAQALVSADAREAAPDLLTAARQGDSRLRQLIEPALAAWKFAPAGPVWQERVRDASALPAAQCLACQGLSALGRQDDTAILRKLLQNPHGAYTVRHAAAMAIGRLDQNQARTLSQELATGTELDRLLCIELLDHPSDQSRKLLLKFCTDPATAVSAAAWLRMFQLSPADLQPLVASGYVHREPTVRETAARVMLQSPSDQHCDWLAALLADRHPGVRNLARTILRQYAEATSDLEQRVIGHLTTALKEPANWQQAEQSLVLATQLEQAHLVADCIPLLGHERPEVFVTAAWMLHVMPDPTLAEQVAAVTTRHRQLCRQRGAQTGFPLQEYNLQLSLLFQFAGSVRHQPLKPLLEEQFNKGSGLSPQARAGAIWAIGLLNEGRGPEEPELVNRLIERLNDRASLVPEISIVRRMAVMSLGRMNARSTVAELRKAMAIDPYGSYIPAAARWALTKLGEETPPPVELRDTVGPVGGWKLHPIRGKTNETDR